jgi:hypothetical protein
VEAIIVLVLHVGYLVPHEMNAVVLWGLMCFELLHKIWKKMKASVLLLLFADP